MAARFIDSNRRNSLPGERRRIDDPSPGITPG
jgi:hypothetical protein